MGEGLGVTIRLAEDDSCPLAEAPRADAGVVATRGIAPSRLFLWFVYLSHMSGNDQKYILTCQV